MCADLNGVYIKLYMYNFLLIRMTFDDFEIKIGFHFVSKSIA